MDQSDMPVLAQAVIAAANAAAQAAQAAASSGGGAGQGAEGAGGSQGVLKRDLAKLIPLTGNKRFCSGEIGTGQSNNIWLLLMQHSKMSWRSWNPI